MLLSDSTDLMTHHTGHLKIGVFDLHSEESTSSGAYSRVIMKSLSKAAQRDQDVSVYAVTANPAGLPDGIQALPYMFYGRSKLHRLRRRIRLSRAHLARRQFPDFPSSAAWWAAYRNEIDVLIPTTRVPEWDCGIPLVGWIPDFQHIHYPSLFSSEERKSRDLLFHSLASSCHRVVLSSRSAHDDYVSFAPQHAAKGTIHPFPSNYAFTPPDADPFQAIRKYNLPQKYLLVINQLWAHKNHMVLIRALGQLKSIGVEPPVVMPGMPSDYRDPSNRHLSTMLQEIHCFGLHRQIFFLGHIPYADLVSLSRSCACMIQPSRFEGWNTSVQDALALGKPVICSDIPVHHEQAPDALGFFGVDDVDGLAELIHRSWPLLAPGFNEAEEYQALSAEQAFAVKHGERLLKLCISSALSKGARPPS
jgi:glycosyltransferase involved in cell wall biosynthesis